MSTYYSAYSNILLLVKIGVGEANHSIELFQLKITMNILHGSITTKLCEK